MASRASAKASPRASTTCATGASSRKSKRQANFSPVAVGVRTRSRRAAEENFGDYASGSSAKVSSRSSIACAAANFSRKSKRKATHLHHTSVQRSKRGPASAESKKKVHNVDCSCGSNITVCDQHAPSNPVVPVKQARVCDRGKEASIERSSLGQLRGDTDLQTNYQYIPGLTDDLGIQCLARLPISELGRLRCINRKLFKLASGGDLFKIRRGMRVSESWIYVVASGQAGWHALDPRTKRWFHLPLLDVDYCFNSSDKESFSVGTQLLVVGRSLECLEMWMYDLVTNKWAKGSMMLTPRCLYAWASCGSFAYLAGGVTLTGEVLQSAERYSPETGQWVRLPDMHERRRLSAGCFMDGKFYVLGGDNEAGVHLTSGEVFDPVTDTWTLIPKMLPWADSRTFPGAPPLIAVVSNNLYILETETNQLKIYLKSTNSWKALGEVPVRTDLVSGWGVAFKSLGDQLLLIGGARTPDHQDGLYICRPNSDGGNSQWDLLTRLCPFGPFVLNCAIVSA